MAFGLSRKTDKTDTRTQPKGLAVKTTQARIHPDDPRGRGHETTYQASRGGWFKKD
ncbi:hypothetical protein ACFVDT_07005 [Streptomyces sp. NPDC057699]|uniref:hypothetical protein n=1 Tax=Streptomyces sp. NPDC057699 TaxID=3346220 RepID=UPI0036C00B6D